MYKCKFCVILINDTFIFLTNFIHILTEHDGLLKFISRKLKTHLKRSYFMATVSLAFLNAFDVIVLTLIFFPLTFTSCNVPAKCSYKKLLP